MEAWEFVVVVLVEGAVRHGEVGVVDLKGHAGMTTWEIGLYKCLSRRCRTGWGYVVVVPAGWS